MTILFCKWLITFVLIKLYYDYFKRFIIFIAPSLSHVLGLNQTYSYAVSASVIELPLIAMSHFIFFLILSYLLNINLFQEKFYVITIEEFFLSALLGIGLMGVSTLGCQIAMALINAWSVPVENLNSWLTLAKGGWLRHHTHSLKVTPLYWSLPLVLLQIASEELIFRGLLLECYLPLGKYPALIISTFLFVAIQKYFMASMKSALFPMIGGLLIGIVHGLLYFHFGLLSPLILSHFFFFCFAIL